MDPTHFGVRFLATFDEMVDIIHKFRPSLTPDRAHRLLAKAVKRRNKVSSEFTIPASDFNILVHGFICEAGKNVYHTIFEYTVQLKGLDDD